MAFYIDTSALVKLVVAEPESTALQKWIDTTMTDLVSSDLARTELIRAVRRGASDQVVEARAVLDSLTLLSLTAATFEAAAHLDPTLLRTLDSLHLASALSLGDDLDGLVTYDERLSEAAQSHGVAVVAPPRPSSQQ